jgi:hypothetical protein
MLVCGGFGRAAGDVLSTVPEMFGGPAITSLKSTSKCLTVPLRQVGMAVGFVAVDVRFFVIVEISASRLDAIMPAVARNFVELAWRYVPAAFLHITRIS